MRQAHRALAIVLALFLALHFANHLAGLAGQEVHGHVQEALRVLYRHPLVEPLLLAAVGAQLGLGIALVARRRRWTRQTLSGGYLALFLAVHLGAVLSARAQGVETDLAFAAAGLHSPAPWPALFAVYYGLAVLAVFAHLSVPLSRRSPGLAPITLGIGAALALTLVALLAGRVTPLTIPPALVAAFP
jgi:succinate dehydrogenase/fumarate reductase cytochrome b subunit